MLNKLSYRAEASEVFQKVFLHSKYFLPRQMFSIWKFDVCFKRVSVAWLSSLLLLLSSSLSSLSSSSSTATHSPRWNKIFISTQNHRLGKKIGLGHFGRIQTLSNYLSDCSFFLGSIVPSTIRSSRSRSDMLKNPTGKFRERRESNPGQLGEKRERYLCALDW